MKGKFVTRSKLQAPSSKVYKGSTGGPGGLTILIIDFDETMRCKGVVSRG